MANINFPGSPLLNQIYEYNEVRWQWNGTGWKQLPQSKFISDTTYSGVWVGGYTADSSTDIFTKVAHGYINGDVLDFRAGTGTLPTGVSAFDIDMIGGEYYQVINKTNDTFQIAAGGGGTVAIDITTNGSDFEIRKGLSATFIHIALPTMSGNESINIDMIINEGKNSSATYSQVYAAFYDSNNIGVNHIGVAHKGYWNIQKKDYMVYKFLISNHRITIKRLDEIRYMANNVFTCFGTNNKISGDSAILSNIIQLQKTNVLYDINKMIINHSANNYIRDVRVIITKS